MTEAIPREPFDAIEPVPLYQQIAGAIRAAIIDRRFGPGDALPPERALADEFKVSRVTVREALRQLEAQGLVVAGRTAQGRRVSDDSYQMLRRAVADALLLQGVSLGDLVELRCAVEVAATSLAARTGDAPSLAKAQAILTRMQENPDEGFDLLDVQFHRALVAASGNAPLQAVMTACRDSQVRYLSGALREHPDRRAVRDRLTSEHKEILDAVLAGDGELAAARTEAHIRRFYHETVEKGGRQASDLHISRQLGTRHEYE